MVPKRAQHSDEIVTPKEVWKHKNEEKYTNNTYTNKKWNCNEINFDNVFLFIVATEITNDFEFKTVDESRQIHD